ncbi:hypothetical protein ACSSS7_008359 [Eimeria intestinalis]
MGASCVFGVTCRFIALLMSSRREVLSCPITSLGPPKVPLPAFFSLSDSRRPRRGLRLSGSQRAPARGDAGQRPSQGREELFASPFGLGAFIPGGVGFVRRRCGSACLAMLATRSRSWDGFLVCTPLGSGAQNLLRNRRKILNGGGFRWPCWGRPLPCSAVYGVKARQGLVVLRVSRPRQLSTGEAARVGEPRNFIRVRLARCFVPVTKSTSSAVVPDSGTRSIMNGPLKAGSGTVLCRDSGEPLAFRLRDGAGPLETAYDSLPQCAGGRAACRLAPPEGTNPLSASSVEHGFQPLTRERENGLLACHEEAVVGEQRRRHAPGTDPVVEDGLGGLDVGTDVMPQARQPIAARQASRSLRDTEMAAVVTEVVCVDIGRRKIAGRTTRGAALAMETQRRLCTRQKRSGLVEGVAAIQSGVGQADAGTPGIQYPSVARGGLRSGPLRAEGHAYPVNELLSGVHGVRGVAGGFGASSSVPERHGGGGAEEAWRTVRLGKKRGFGRLERARGSRRVSLGAGAMLHLEFEFLEPQRPAFKATTLIAVIADKLEGRMVGANADLDRAYVVSESLKGPDDGRGFEIGGRPLLLVVVQGAGGVGDNALAVLVGLQGGRAEAVARAVAVEVGRPLVVWVVRVSEEGFGAKGPAEGAPGDFSFGRQGEVAGAGGCLEQRRRDNGEAGLAKGREELAEVGAMVGAVVAIHDDASMSSTAETYFMPPSSMSIMRWNITGLEAKPKGRRRYCRWESGVTKLVFGRSSSAIPIW